MLFLEVKSNLEKVKRQNLVLSPTTYRFREKLDRNINRAFTETAKSVKKEIISSMHRKKSGRIYLQGYFRDKLNRTREINHTASAPGEGLASYSGKSEKQIEYKVLSNNFRMTLGSKAPSFVYWEQDADDKLKRPTIKLAIQKKHTDFLRYFKNSFRKD